MTVSQMCGRLPAQDLVYADVRHARDRSDLPQTRATLSGGADSRAPLLISRRAALRGPLHAGEIGRHLPAVQLLGERGGFAVRAEPLGAHHVINTGPGAFRRRGRARRAPLTHQGGES